MSTKKIEQYFKVKQIAQMTQNSESYYWKNIYNGNLQSVKFGRSRRVSESALNAFIDENNPAVNH